MNIPEHFKSIARTSKRPTTKDPFLPAVRQSVSPKNHLSSPLSRSPAPGHRSKRSISNTPYTLPDLKNSKSGSRTSGTARMETGKASDRPCGVVKAYAVNSYSGRHHNEDRLSIIINIQCPSDIEENIWPSSSFYGLYDGHSGKACSEYLKKHLAELILKNKHFPRNTKKAIFSGFIQADKEFLSVAKENGEMSGSCATVVMIIGDKCFVANTGDSRAFICLNQGKNITTISTEHKPGDTNEYNRIINAGGKVYNNYMINDKGENYNFGPHLLAPGKLKVSRAFGDLDAKDEEYGGNPKVLIPDPHIKSFPIRPDQDFMFIATASVFEKFTNREISDIVFGNITSKKGAGIDLQMLSAIDEIFNEAINRVCDENMSVILIALKGLKLYSEENAK